ncbi:TIGR04076 family protein [Faecalicatena contorta]|uniref:TIGR04076 family protein n=1 Tax=Faecalicatena contorta TaxID=39482 RepID=A0A316A303_9FIRM|nr:TIGR04076 family protein [Faecalicatena contorta]PWJ51912.1 putative repeat protein (TIGR04076 family) [Faecalicatena contorta]SUQ12190.1 TIGR04076 family protein [Faecalicatena contorta]
MCITTKKQFEYKVETVSGHCSCGYKVGDVFYCEGMNTPTVPFCGGAYMALFPIQVALHNGARFHFENNPKLKRNLACPDNGYVVFCLTLLDDK